MNDNFESRDPNPETVNLSTVKPGAPETTPKSKTRPIVLATAGAVAAMLAATGGAVWFNNQPDSTAVTPQPTETAIADPSSRLNESPTAPQPTPAPTATTPGNGIGGPSDPVPPAASPVTAGAAVYWVGADNNQIQFEPEPIAIKPDTAPDIALETAFAELLSGEKTTAIPTNTKLLGVTVSGDDVRLNLSKEFTSGGGSTSMAARLGQVVYTTTAVQPNAKLWLSVEGKLLEVLGGEGLVIEQPLTEEVYQRDFSF